MTGLLWSKAPQMVCSSAKRRDSENKASTCFGVELNGKKKLDRGQLVITGEVSESHKVSPYLACTWGQPVCDPSPPGQPKTQGGFVWEERCLRSLTYSVVHVDPRAEVFASQLRVGVLGVLANIVMTPPLLLLVLLAGHLSSATKWDGLTPWFSGSCECAVPPRTLHLQFKIHPEHHVVIFDNLTRTSVKSRADL